MRNTATSEKRLVRFLNISTNNCQSSHLKRDLSHNIFFTTILPLFDTNGDVQGTITFGSPFKNTNVDLYHYLTGTLKQTNQDAEKAIECLSPREFEIVYLLSKGMSQRDVAAILGISRGTVSKIITDNIYHKLGLDNHCCGAIIRKAITLDIDREVPKSLLKPQIIALN